MNKLSVCLRNSLVLFLLLVSTNSHAQFFSVPKAYVKAAHHANLDKMKNLESRNGSKLTAEVINKAYIDAYRMYVLVYDGGKGKRSAKLEAVLRHIETIHGELLSTKTRAIIYVEAGSTGDTETAEYLDKHAGKQTAETLMNAYDKAAQNQEVHFMEYMDLTYAKGLPVNQSLEVTYLKSKYAAMYIAASRERRVHVMEYLDGLKLEMPVASAYEQARHTDVLKYLDNTHRYKVPHEVIIRKFQASNEFAQKYIAEKHKHLNGSLVLPITNGGSSNGSNGSKGATSTIIGVMAVGANQPQSNSSEIKSWAGVDLAFLEAEKRGIEDVRDLVSDENNLKRISAAALNEAFSRHIKYRGIENVNNKFSLDHIDVPAILIRDDKSYMEELTQLTPAFNKYLTLNLHPLIQDIVSESIGTPREIIFIQDESKFVSSQQITDEKERFKKFFNITDDLSDPKSYYENTTQLTPELFEQFAESYSIDEAREYFDNLKGEDGETWRQMKNAVEHDPLISFEKDKQNKKAEKILKILYATHKFGFSVPKGEEMFIFKKNAISQAMKLIDNLGVAPNLVSALARQGILGSPAGAQSKPQSMWNPALANHKSNGFEQKEVSEDNKIAKLIQDKLDAILVAVNNAQTMTDDKNQKIKEILSLIQLRHTVTGKNIVTLAKICRAETKSKNKKTAMALAQNVVDLFKVYVDMDGFKYNNFRHVVESLPKGFIQKVLGGKIMGNVTYSNNHAKIYSDKLAKIVEVKSGNWTWVEINKDIINVANNISPENALRTEINRKAETDRFNEDKQEKDLKEFRGGRK